MSGVRQLVRASKDLALGLAIRTAFNVRFRKIGEMTELSIDTKAGSDRLRLQLRGESEPIEVTIKKYHLKRRSDGLLLTIDDASSSREWLSALLREVIVGRSIEIPEKVGAVLNVLA